MQLSQVIASWTPTKSKWEKRAVIGAAKGTPGVWDVVDRVRIEPRPT